MIPKDLYYCIPEDARVEFNRNRHKLTQKQSPTGYANAKPTPKPVDAKPAATVNSGRNNNSLPKQYTTRANLADTEQSFVHDHSDNIQEDDEDDLSTNEDSLCDPSQYMAFLNRYHGHVDSHQEDRDFFMSTVEIQSMNVSNDTGHSDWVIETNHNLSMSLDGQNYLLLSDNGANSCLISRKAFHIDSIDPHRKAVMKGCKDSYVSKGNPIGVGRAVVVGTNPRDPPIGICISEAAIHHDDVSLLSEFQACGFDTVVNSIPRRHSTPHSMAQSLCPSPDVTIPFQV